MEKTTFKKLAEMVLEKNKEPMSAMEIMEQAKKEGMLEQLQSKGKTPEATLMAQLYMDIKENKNSAFCQPSKRPAKFQLKKYFTEGTIKEPSKEKEAISNKRHKIYAFRVGLNTTEDISVVKVKIGHTNNIRATESQYKRSHSGLVRLGLWNCNMDVSPTSCEKGIHKIAKKYSLKSEREIFILLDDKCKELIEHINLLLVKT
jgi:hypothetical protein